MPVVDHLAAAAAALLGRLEDHDRGAVEIARLGEILRGTEQHRGVAVVAAGVHLAGILRFVRQTGGFLDRQRVHVGAKPDGAGAATPLAADHTDHTGAADAAHHLVAAEGFKLLGDHAGRTVHVEQQLRMGVDILPPSGNFRKEIGDTINDRHGIAP